MKRAKTGRSVKETALFSYSLITHYSEIGSYLGAKAFIAAQPRM